MLEDPVAELLPSVRALLDEAASRPQLDPSATVAELRAAADAGLIDLHRFVRGSDHVTTHDLSVLGESLPGESVPVPVRLHVPADLGHEAKGPSGDGNGVGRLHVHLHGGGWWMGSIATADPMCRELAAAMQVPVLSVDYRLAPEHPFPAGLDDVLGVLRWVATSPTELVDLGFPVETVTLSGESAGANLAASAALALRDAGESLLRGVWLDVPAVDFTVPPTPSLEQFGTGYGLEIAMLPLMGHWYFGGATPTDPRVSPQFGDLAGLPPFLVTTAEFDPLRDQGAAFVGSLRTAGVEVSTSCHEGHIHGSSWLTALDGYDHSWYEGVIRVVKSWHGVL
jgi:acetyl esterase